MNYLEAAQFFIDSLARAGGKPEELPPLEEVARRMAELYDTGMAAIERDRARAAWEEKGEGAP